MLHYLRVPKFVPNVTQTMEIQNYKEIEIESYNILQDDWLKMAILKDDLIEYHPSMKRRYNQITTTYYINQK